MNAGPPKARVAPVISRAPVVGPWKAIANNDPVKKPSTRLSLGSTPNSRRYASSLPDDCWLIAHLTVPAALGGVASSPHTTVPAAPAVGAL
jgi:hypothetical protein